MDKHVFTEKVLEAESTLYHIAKSLLINEKDCEDAVQDGILKAYEKLHTLKEERYFKSWLVRILINQCYLMHRSQKPVLSYEDSLIDESAELHEDYTDLYREIYSLKPHIRITIVLYYMEGYSVNEIKDILKIPSGTVKSRLAKGRKVLKEKLESKEVIYG